MTSREKLDAIVHRLITMMHNATESGNVLNPEAVAHTAAAINGFLAARDAITMIPGFE